MCVRKELSFPVIEHINISYGKLEKSRDKRIVFMGLNSK